nr:MAG TPA: hypothetical protein [Caudoviricetes sp.]
MRLTLVLKMLISIFIWFPMVYSMMMINMMNILLLKENLKKLAIGKLIYLVIILKFKLMIRLLKLLKELPVENLRQV